MRHTIKKLWVKALRSGKYKQTTQCLKEIDVKGKSSYCCLGVLCDLYAKEKGTSWTSFGASATSASLSLSRLKGTDSSIGAVLPYCVREWAGLGRNKSNENPSVKYKGMDCKLTDLNDSRLLNFTSIAAAIDESL